MNRILNLVAVPVDASVLPVSVSELKLFLQLQGTANDAQLLSYIKAATTMVEKALNRGLRPLTITLKFEQRNPDVPCVLPYPPLAAITSAKWQECPIRFTDMDLNYDYYIINSGDADAAFYGERTRGQMAFPTYRVIYTTGTYTDAAAIEAVKIQAGFMWTNRDNVTNAIAPQAAALISSVTRGTF